MYSRALLLHLQRAADPKLVDEQFGFRPNRSTDEALFVASDVLLQHALGTKPMVMVMVDLSKAYDRLWRDGLWWKCIHQFQLPPKMVQVLMESYSGSSSRVRLAGRLSTPFLVPTGVKQGNVLSPLLFSMFINDLAQALHAEVPGVTLAQLPTVERLTSLHFADDVGITCGSVAQAQKALDVLSGWCKRWGMQVSNEKTQWLGVHVPAGVSLSFEGTALQRKSWLPYLGVPLSEDGSWTPAVDAKVAKAKDCTRKLLPFLTNKQIPTWVRLQVWSAKVRPLLEYGNSMIGFDAKQMEKVERVLRFGVKKIMRVNIHTPNVVVEGETGLRSVKYRTAKARCRLAWHIRENGSNLARARLNRAPLAGVPHASRVKLPSQILAKLLQDLAREGGDSVGSCSKKLQNQECQRWQEECAKKKTLAHYSKVKKHMRLEPYLRGLNSNLVSFWFKVRSNTLPTQECKARGRPAVALACPLCGHPEEDIIHCLLACPSTAIASARSALLLRLEEAQQTLKGASCTLRPCCP